MKMKNYRLFLLGFVTLSFVLLTGFKQLGINNAPPAKKAAASIQIKKYHVKVKENPANSKQKKEKNRQLALRAKNSAAEAIELQRTLDLSIPFNDSENAWLTVEQNRIAQAEAANMFAAEKKNKPGSIDLDGQMLMSQEPETDKRKSLDGAAIVINLKR
jgi:hypothetical protein